MLLRCAAHYLGREMQDGKPLDPVARFHLGNGARVERLNWAGDPSAKGLKQSYGLMVNYLYDLKRLDKHRAQLAQGKIPISTAHRGPVSLTLASVFNNKQETNHDIDIQDLTPAQTSCERPWPAAALASTHCRAACPVRPGQPSRSPWSCRSRPAAAPMRLPGRWRRSSPS